VPFAARIVRSSTPMKSIVSSLVLAASLGLSSLGMVQAAFAQQPGSGDVEYCRSMARAYLTQLPAQEAPTVADGMLLDDCSKNTSGSTVGLKEKLAWHGIDMPKPAVAGAQ